MLIGGAKLSRLAQHQASTTRLCWPFQSFAAFITSLSYSAVAYPALLFSSTVHRGTAVAQ
jgi:hypothetical protein